MGHAQLNPVAQLSPEADTTPEQDQSPTTGIDHHRIVVENAEQRAKVGRHLLPSFPYSVLRGRPPYSVIPFVRITSAYQSNDFFFDRSMEPRPELSRST